MTEVETAKKPAEISKKLDNAKSEREAKRRYLGGRYPF